MEPMTLGSPVHSPPPGSMGHYSHVVPSSSLSSSSPGVLGTPNHSGFLPGFLMGDTTSPPPSAPSRILSPSKLNRSLSHVQQQQQQQPPCHPVSTPRFNKSLRGTPGNEKTPGGPPITGLYSKVGGTPQGRELFAAQTPKSGLPGTPMPYTPQLSFGASPPPEDLQVSPWITVFGFPPSATGYILSQFSQYGVILQHESPPNGNWMHIRYQTKMMSQKALSKNGKVLGGSIMIGVRPGGQADDPAEASLLNTTDMHGVPNASTLNSSKLETSVLNRSTIRPLTQAYKVSQTEHEILADSNTPSKNNGFVNKAMEYIFGW